MSSDITVFAINSDQLRTALGSRDRALSATIVAGAADYLASINEINDEAGLTCAEAVAQLIDGETSPDVPGFLYGYALEAMCGHLGRELPNICPIAGASEWIEEVDEFLKSQGVTISLNDLVMCGSPVPIPQPDDYPFIGFWPAEEVPAALASIRGVDLAPLDQEMAETIEQMRQWLEETVKTPGASVVGFLS